MAAMWVPFLSFGAKRKEVAKVAIYIVPQSTLGLDCRLLRSIPAEVVQWYVFYFNIISLFLKNIQSWKHFTKLYNNRHIIGPLGPTAMWYGSWRCYSVFQPLFGTTVVNYQPPYHTVVWVSPFWISQLFFVWTRMEKII